MIDDHNRPLLLRGEPLLISDVVDVARRDRGVLLAPGVTDRLLQSRKVIDAALGDGLPHYGINTGFGSLSRQRIGEADLRDLQRNLIRSHSAGVGEPLRRDIVRGMMLLLAASLCRGCSGVRPAVVELLVGLLNAGITPKVPSVGSVGASGDLAPLAAIGLVLIGEGEAFMADGQLVAGAAALAKAGLSPITLEAKEGLAIINGTHLMASRGALLMHDGDRLVHAAITAAAMTIDACRGTDSFLDPRVHEVRNQPGQIAAAKALKELLVGSTIIPSHREDDPRVQDPYSLRCTPQVLGAAIDCLAYCRGCIANELGAVTDNPLVFAEGGEVISAGNFHGMPMAIPLDTMTIAVAHIAGISERRTFWMLSAFDAESHLRPYLAPKPGLHSGLMIAQYTAAACCNEIISLSGPASVANVSTSAGIEDYNSFGPRAAAKAARAVELGSWVVAVELLCAAEGLEYHRPLRSGVGVEKAHAAVRSVVPRLTQDRPLTVDIERISALILSGGLQR
ncbi:MAG: histidine ammonia-lyase [Planctomycetes bacterium]|nr:histidine ammonia-lyase [Planctomycetota bacterium]